MPATLVVLPTYNEIENLASMIHRLLSLPVTDLSVLIVDDNSPDGTGILADQLAQQNPERVVVLHRSRKEGLGKAYIAGFNRALSLGADYIVQMDADFSHNPDDIPRLLECIQNQDLVIGSRYVQGARVDETWSLSRKLLSWFANCIYLPLVLRLPVYDATGGFRIWRRDTLLGIGLHHIQSNGYIFQVEMCYVTHRLGYRVAEMPIYFADRRQGNSKMSRRIQIEAAIGAWKMRRQYKALDRTMREPVLEAYDREIRILSDSVPDARP